MWRKRGAPEAATHDLPQIGAATATPLVVAAAAAAAAIITIIITGAACCSASSGKEADVVAAATTIAVTAANAVFSVLATQVYGMVLLKQPLQVNAV